jgi:uncharacterized coiled-coil protein SlyX
MSELPVQSDGIDVERIMEQIRARIEHQRGGAAGPAANAGGAAANAGGAAADAGGAAGLLPSESFGFDGNSIYWSSRGGVGRVLYGIRRLLRPLLKFVFNIDPMVDALATQVRLNAQQAEFDDRVAQRLAALEEQDVLSRQVLQNLTAEMRQLSTEMKNHRILVESLAERLDSCERQARPPVRTPPADQPPPPDR